MHSLEPEIRQLIETQRIGAAAAAQPLAAESRGVFSVRKELRAVLYAGIAAVVAGVGLIVQANLGRIGALSIAVALGVAAVLCYVPAIRALRRGAPRRLPADSLLLLGTLLVSADLGYAEHVWQLLGANWSRHLLLLAALHAATAYCFDSRLVLSVALTSFAAWIGADTTFSFFLPFSRANLRGTGWSSLLCALVFVACRALHAWRLTSHRGFVDVYERFAVHLAGIGALLLMLPGFYDRPLPTPSLVLGTAVLIGVVALIGGIGWRRRQGSFMLVALGYAIVGSLRLEFHVLDDAIPIAGASLVTLVGGIVLLWRVHKHFKDEA